MPQLDPSTYPSQVFWFVIFFFATYYFFLNTILPAVARALKARSAASLGNISFSQTNAAYPDDKVLALRSVRMVSRGVAQLDKDYDKARLFVGQTVYDPLVSDILSLVESAHIRKNIDAND